MVRPPITILLLTLCSMVRQGSKFRKTVYFTEYIAQYQIYSHDNPDSNQEQQQSKNSNVIMVRHGCL